MNIYLINNDFYYETEKLAKVFFPNEKFFELHEEPASECSDRIVIRLNKNGDTTSAFAELCTGDFCETRSCTAEEGEDSELAAADLLYDMLVKMTGVSQPWGLLTGVRPIKLFRRLKETMGEEETKAHFENVFHVSHEKTELTSETERAEAQILASTTKESFSLYISVPFCPTRCSYCSFVSASTARTKHLIEPYTELLCRELEKTAEIVKANGLKLDSVYMGGGTPTTLSADQMARVLSTVTGSFDMSTCREFTVEAGRPDTVTEEKLRAIRSCGIDRISINPQTLSDIVLEEIGRKHTTQDFYNAYELARKIGFGNINTDVIAGLPADTLDSFKNTMDTLVYKLAPESVTVHTLAMKRASTLTQDGKMLDKEEAELAMDMVAYSSRVLHDSGYKPYYLYRQSRMVGNLENTGWSKPGKECLYNVFIMDESQSVIACGAGAVTKIVTGSGKLERIFNYKYPYEYINSFDEVLKRKEGIVTLYDQLR